MAERRVYNERFLYPDPLSKTAGSKATRYRALRKRRYSEQQLEECNGTTVSHAISEPHYSEMTAECECKCDDVTGCSASDNSQDCDNTVEHVASGVCVSETDLLLGDFYACPEEVSSEDETEYGLINDDVDNQGQDESTTSQDDHCMVFSNCPLTVTGSTLLIKKFQMRHNLTQEALADLLQLMRLHFPSPNLCPATLYLFNKQLPVLRDPLEFTYFCSRCLQEIPNKDESTCPNISCGHSLTEQGAVSSFIEVPLEPQLVTILQSMHLFIVSTMQ